MHESILARRPNYVSVSELLTSGELSESSVREDGTVNETIRRLAEDQYRNNRGRATQMNERPQSAPASSIQTNDSPIFSSFVPQMQTTEFSNETQLRVTFADDACMICLMSFSDLIHLDKITFAKCQHTLCMPCFLKHISTHASKQTPCCRQQLSFTITNQNISVEERFLMTLSLGQSYRMPVDIFSGMYMIQRYNDGLQTIRWNLHDFDRAFFAMGIVVRNGSHWWTDSMRTGSWLYGVGLNNIMTTNI